MSKEYSSSSSGDNHTSTMAMLLGARNIEVTEGPYLPGNDCNFGHSCLSKCIEKLGAMTDDAPVFLCCA